MSILIISAFFKIFLLLLMRTIRLEMKAVSTFCQRESGNQRIA
jgi:hypothetical protein